MAHLRVAHNIMKLINETMISDQGASFREWSGRVLPHIGDAYRGKSKPFREHLGASILGKECIRSIWYDYRWVTLKAFDGRMLRLFNRGHLEEGRFIAMLLMIGCKVLQQDSNGKQFQISHRNGLIGGSGDGIAFNVPGVRADQAVVLEFKTHGEKSFDKLREHGVKAAKFEHYAQMQLYMHKMGIGQALYMAVNKNTDELYAEFVVVNPELAMELLDRGERILDEDVPPKKIHNSASYFKCRFCDHKEVCHYNALPYKTCRTCAFAKIENDEWICRKHNKNVREIDGVNHMEGCYSYELMSVLA